MTSSRKYYEGGSSFLFTIADADFELNTSVILSSSGNIIFKYLFVQYI